MPRASSRADVVDPTVATSGLAFISLAPGSNTHTRAPLPRCGSVAAQRDAVPPVPSPTRHQRVRFYSSRSAGVKAYARPHDPRHALFAEEAMALGELLHGTAQSVCPPGRSAQAVQAAQLHPVPSTQRTGDRLSSSFAFLVILHDLDSQAVHSAVPEYHDDLGWT